MAEIKVEPKKKAPIWPWIIGILILLGLIWLLVEAFDSGEEYEEEPIEEIEQDAQGYLSTDTPQHLVLHIYQTPEEGKPEQFKAA